MNDIPQGYLKMKGKDNTMQTLEFYKEIQRERQKERKL